MATNTGPAQASTLFRGSQWRKWDLQACTQHYSNYHGLNLPTEQLNTLATLTGLPKDKINSDHKTVSNEEFARLYVEYLASLTDLSVVAITNHNTGEGIQTILDYLAEKAQQDNSRYRQLQIFPGVEITANDKVPSLNCL